MCCWRGLKGAGGLTAVLSLFGPQGERLTAAEREHQGELMERRGCVC